MIEVTADTNVYISALNFAGLPRQLLLEAQAGSVKLAITAHILEEVTGVLQAKFQWSERAIAEAIALISACTIQVTPTQVLDVVETDPDDNRIIECALAAGSRYIVTGDRDLLRLGSHEAIQIVKVADFLTMLERMRD